MQWQRSALQIKICLLTRFVSALTAFCLSLLQEDLQLLMQQQVLAQQQAEQAQKKPSRMGLLRRHNKPPIQRPSSNTYSSPAPSTVNSSQIFISRLAVSAAPSAPSPPSSRRNWMDKLRRGKSSTRQEEQDSEWDAGDNGFQVVSLDWSSGDFALWAHLFWRTTI